MYEAVLFERVVVDAGRVVLDGPPAEVFRDVEQLREVGLDGPLAASLAHRLRARGIPIGEDILNTSDLRAAPHRRRSLALRLMQPDGPYPGAEGL